jgi:hypothetical protein
MKKYIVSIQWEAEVYAKDDYEAEQKAGEMWADCMEPIIYNVEEVTKDMYKISFNNAEYEDITGFTTEAEAEKYAQSNCGCKQYVIKKMEV